MTYNPTNSYGETGIIDVTAKTIREPKYRAGGR